MWAKSAEALGNTKEAMSAYERVLLLDSTNSEAALALLNIYVRTSRVDLADKLYIEVKSMSLTPGQKKDFEALKQKYFIFDTSIFFALSGGYDSNVNVSASGLILDDYGLTDGEIETYFTRLTGVIQSNIKHKDYKNWSLKSNIMLFTQVNSDAEKYNLFVGALSSGIEYKNSNYNFFIPFSYERIYYLKEDLLSQVKIEPKASLLLSKNYIVDTMIFYSKREYIPSDYKRIADASYGTSIAAKYMFSRNYFSMKAGYEKFYPTTNKKSKYLNKNQLLLQVAGSYRIKKVKLKLDATYRESIYTDSIIDIRDLDKVLRREDENYLFNLDISYPYKQGYTFFSKYKYVLNNSNNELSQYSKLVASFGLNINY
ncbi:hypothetical protein JHD49_09600 [Sulfurimonas sp. SAG-AH-194-C21]|nr:hypothetical protein [Sulfurimonas sp. SAG-AH-194-C21]MDF1884194.1 hypothetical protein [Sulfurimonas sp. SAG-AH-194-C21]